MAKIKPISVELIDILFLFKNNIDVILLIPLCESIVMKFYTYFEMSFTHVNY